MEWQRQMSVGYAEFDEAHKRLIALLTRVHEALKDGRVEEAGALVRELSAEAAAHTEREEDFLRQAGYPDVETLIGAQKDSLTRIVELGKLLAADPVTADEAVLEMRLNFIDYLLRADINFKSFLQDEGLSDC